MGCPVTKFFDDVKRLSDDHADCDPGDYCSAASDLRDIVKRHESSRRAKQAQVAGQRCSVKGCTSILTIVDRGTICRECRFDQKAGR